MASRMSMASDKCLKGYCLLIVVPFTTSMYIMWAILGRLVGNLPKWEAFPVVVVVVVVVVVGWEAVPWLGRFPKSASFGAQEYVARVRCAVQKPST